LQQLNNHHHTHIFRDKPGEKIAGFETVGPIYFERMPIETCYLFIEKLLANGKAWKMVCGN